MTIYQQVNMLKLNKVMNDGLAHADMMRYRMGWELWLVESVKILIFLIQGLNPGLLYWQEGSLWR